MILGGGVGTFHIPASESQEAEKSGCKKQPLTPVRPFNKPVRALPELVTVGVTDSLSVFED